MSDPKTDCEALLNFALPFAEQMLAAHGEFFPFAAAMRPGGQIVSIAGYNGTERPPSADLIALMKAGFVASARNGEYKATAIVYDALVKPPSGDEKSDAMAVALDHRDTYSITGFFPYNISGGKLTVSPPFALKGEADIFPAQ